MNSICKSVKEYWSRGLVTYKFDPHVLQDVIDSLNSAEAKLLTKGEEVCEASDTLKNSFALLMKKILNRHNDVVCGATTIGEDGEITVSPRSCITELDIQLNTVTECEKVGMLRIGDVVLSKIVDMTLETVADLSVAMLLFMQGEADNAASAE